MLLVPGERAREGSAGVDDDLRHDMADIEMQYRESRWLLRRETIIPFNLLYYSASSRL